MTRRFLVAALAAALLSWDTAGNAAELKVTTWNLEWLTLRAAGDPALPRNVNPKRPEDLARLSHYATLLASDVIAIQEVDGPAAAAAVFPPDRFAIHLTGDRGVQRAGFAIRRGVAFQPNPDFAALAPPGTELRPAADITLKLPVGSLRLLSLHLKQGCRQDRLTDLSRAACPVLRDQLAALQTWITERRDEGSPFLVMGDFNRWMDGKDPFYAALQHPAPLLRATEDRFSPCWGGGGFIDHIIAGGAARAWLRPDTLRVLVYRETDEEWRARLSDHCPVSVKLVVPDHPVPPSDPAAAHARAAAVREPLTGP